MVYMRQKDNTMARDYIKNPAGPAGMSDDERREEIYWRFALIMSGFSGVFFLIDRFGSDLVATLRPDLIMAVAILAVIYCCVQSIRYGLRADGE